MKKTGLSGLVDALETKAREYRAITYDTAIRQTAEKPLNDGTAAALEEIAAQMRQIDSKNDDPERELEAIKALVERLESEVRLAVRQPRDPPDIGLFLLNPKKLLDSLRDTGRQDGVRHAAELIRKYLTESEG